MKSLHPRLEPQISNLLFQSPASIFPPAPSTPWKLVKKKKKEKGRKEKKNITRVEFAKIYDAGSFAKVARGDTVERGWRAFDKWIEITNYPRPFRRGFAFDKERGDWFLPEIERERSIVIIRTWTVAGFCAPRVRRAPRRCSRSSAPIDS